MALMNCPECTHEVSDKVKSCPHCGYPLAEDSTNSEPQRVELTSVRIDKQKTKKVFFGAIALLIITVIGVVIFSLTSASSYIENLKETQALMLVGGGEAETLSKLTARVWGNCIFEKSDSVTNKFTKKNNGAGFFHDDFNTALQKLFEDSKVKESITNIQANQESVKEAMKDLQNPPEKLKDCYDTVTALYGSYTALTDLAVNPSGNLSGYSSNISDTVDEFQEHFEKLVTQIPEK